MWIVLLCILSTILSAVQLYNLSSYLIIYSTTVASKKKTTYVYNLKSFLKKISLKSTNVMAERNDPSIMPCSPSAERVSPESSASAWHSSSSRSTSDHCRLYQDICEALAGTPGSKRQNINAGFMWKSNEGSFLLENMKVKLALWDTGGGKIRETLHDICTTNKWYAHLLAVVPEEFSCVFNDLLVGELRVGLLLTQSQNLPQSHTECPHVTGHGELTLREHTA